MRIVDFIVRLVEWTACAEIQKVPPKKTACKKLTNKLWISLGSKGSGRKAAEVAAACQEALTGNYDMCDACPNSDSISKLLPYSADFKHTDLSLMIALNNVQNRFSHPEIQLGRYVDVQN